MAKYLLFICPGEPLPVTLISIEEDEPAKAYKVALEALEKWVETGKAAGFSNVERPKAYFTPDLGVWL